MFALIFPEWRSLGPILRPPRRSRTPWQGFKVAIYTTLYGIEIEEAERIIAHITKHAEQIEYLCLHLPDQNGNMRSVRYSAEFENCAPRFHKTWKKRLATQP
jgi:hypothetical protein